MNHTVFNFAHTIKNFKTHSWKKARQLYLPGNFL